MTDDDRWNSLQRRMEAVEKTQREQDGHIRDILTRVAVVIEKITGMTLRVTGIEDIVKRLVWLVLGALVTGAMVFVIGGGLNG